MTLFKQPFLLNKNIVPLTRFELVLSDCSEQIGSKCASLFYILCISVLLQNLVIGRLATNHIFLSLRAYD